MSDKQIRDANAAQPIQIPAAALMPMSAPETEMEIDQELVMLEKIATIQPLPPTDVGITPWLQVVGAFFMMFDSWGIVMSYGTFQTYYTAGGITDQASPSAIAWIGSIQAFFLMFGGAMGGPFFDAGYFRPMLWAGSFMIVFGMMIVSLADKYYQFILAQAMVVGGGMGLFAVASLALPGTWFSKRRGLAVGLVSTGSSVGGVVFPVLLHELIPRIGFPWATRILAFVALATLAIPLAVAKQRLPPRRRPHFIEYPALRQTEFLIYVVSIFITFLGFFMFYTFVESWAANTHVDTMGLPIFYILPIVNAASAFGRVIPNYVSDFVGPLNVQGPAIAIAGILVLVWIPTHAMAPLMVIAILYGFFSGTLVSVPPMVIASMTQDLTTLGGRIGIVFIAMALASLAGAPVSGAIIQAQGGSYDGARIWAGLALLAGANILAAARVTKTGWKLLVKA